MSSVRGPESARLRVAPADLVLTNWPLRDRKRIAWPLAIVLVGLSIAASWAAGHWGAGVGAGAALFAATWRWWVPVTFTFSPAGIHEAWLGRARRRPWNSFARFQTLEHGLVLCPDAEDVPASTLRGRYIAWLDQRAELLAVVEYYLGPRSSDSYWLRSTVDEQT